ncbi:MAG: Holliday junction resolvase RuvX [Verrucomicrobia bacterium]|nr:Holliday junction resolvase RuvX [Verrucomicrobiota bacterium]
MSRILSIDFGKKRIGLALSDEQKILASPLATLEAKVQLAGTVAQLVEKFKEYDLEEIVIGLPLRLSGQSGLQADEVKHFAKQLEGRTEARLILWDERLTSTQAERAMREGGLSRKKRSKLIDACAAVIILQSYLDSRQTGQSPL